jgi:hypothetical protein
MNSRFFSGLIAIKLSPVYNARKVQIAFRADICVLARCCYSTSILGGKKLVHFLILMCRSRETYSGARIVVIAICYIRGIAARLTITSTNTTPTTKKTKTKKTKKNKKIKHTIW